MDVFCRFPLFASLAVLRLSLTSVTGVHLTPLMSVDHLCLPECTSLCEFALVRNLCPAERKKKKKKPKDASLHYIIANFITALSLALLR